MQVVKAVTVTGTIAVGIVTAKSPSYVRFTFVENSIAWQPLRSHRANLKGRRNIAY